MAVLQTYQVTTNREDLTDIITNITPTKTPFLSSIRSTKAYNTLHEVMTDTATVPTANDNARVEGLDFQDEAQHAPTRVGTYTQIIAKYPKVSGTQQAVKTAGGIKNLYNYNVTLKLKEAALAIEYADINGTGNSGASGTAREIKGFLACIATNTATSTAASGDALTETMLNDLLEDIWDNGGDPDAVYCTGSLKRKISGFTGGATKNVDAKAKKLIASVDVYEGDFGLQKIIAHRLMPAKTIAALEQDKWAQAWLRKTKHEPLAKTGDSVRGQIVGETALEARNEKANGKYLNVLGL